MSVKINKKNFLISVFFILIILQILVIRWLDLSMKWSYLIDIVCVILLINKYNYFRVKIFFGVTIFTFILYPIINFLINGGSIGILYSNCKYSFRIGLTLAIFYYIADSKFSWACQKMNSLFMILNIYYLLNIPALILEISGNYFFSGMFSYTPSHIYSFDMISGLLGFYGTPVLGLFTTFMFIYNLNYLKKLRGTKRIFINIYNISMLIFMIFITQINDNKGFYLVFVFSILCYYILTYYSNISTFIHKKFLKNLKTIFRISIMIVIVIFFGMKIDAVREEIEKYINLALNGFTLGIAAHGSGERFGMISSFLKNSNHLLFGYGFGNYGWRQADTYGFAHFGQNDASSILYFGGLIYLVLITISFILFINKCINIGLARVVLVLMFLYLIIYTQILTDASMMFLFILIVFEFMQIPILNSVKKV